MFGSKDMNTLENIGTYVQFLSRCVVWIDAPFEKSVGIVPTSPRPSQDWGFRVFVCINPKVKGKNDILGFVFILTSGAALYLQTLFGQFVFIASY